MFLFVISDKKINFAIMIEFDRHIEVLLLDNDCVIVPNLGGFMAHYVDARHDDNDNMFLPPLRTVGFNQKLTMNDSLLVQSYVETYDISYPEALSRIEDEVEELKANIEENGTYELNDIGTLSINSYGVYEFAPFESGILTPDLYGLGSFEILKLRAAGKSSDAQAVTSAHAGNHFAHKGKEEDYTVTDKNRNEDNAKTISLSEYYDNISSNDDDTINIKVSLLRNISAAAVAIIAFFFLSSPLEVNTTGATHDTGIRSGVFYHLINEASDGSNTTTKSNLVRTHKTTSSITTAKAEGLCSNNKPEASDIKAPAAVKEKEVAEIKTVSKEYFYIVLASRVTKKNAEYFVSELHKSGISNASVLRTNNINRVVCGKFTNEAEAYNALKDLRKESRYADAWVFKANN